MQSSHTVTFSADQLRAHLDVLSLRTVSHDAQLPALCRIDVGDGRLSVATTFRQGIAGISIPANSASSFQLAVAASRLETFRYMQGGVTFSTDGHTFRYRTDAGASSTGEVHPAALVPEIPLPSQVAIESATSLATFMEFCSPFGEGAVRRAGKVVSAGEARRSINIEMASQDAHWTVTRNAVRLVRDYVRTADGPIKVLSEAGKMGLATEHSWIVWPESVAPEIGVLRPAGTGAEQVELDAESMAGSVSMMIGEVGQAWFEMRLNEQASTISWRAGGESAQSYEVPFVGSCNARLRLHAVDLRLLFPKDMQGTVTLALESRRNVVVLTSTESTQIDGQPASIRRSVAAATVAENLQ